MKIRKNLLYIIAICLIIAVIFVLIFASLGEGVNTEPVILPTAALPDSSGSGDLDPGASQSEVTINAETVQAVIASLSRSGTYFRTLTVERFWSGGGSSTLADVYVDGSSSKTIIHEESGDRHILIVSDKLWMWRAGESGIFTAGASEYDSDLFQSIPTYEDILALPQVDIKDAGYEEFGGEYCIFVKYINGHFGYETTAYISPVSGLLVGCKKYDGEDLIYAVTSDVISFEAFGADVFALPR